MNLLMGICIGSSIMLWLVVGWYWKEQHDYHPYRTWRGKQRVTVEFYLGPLDKQRATLLRRIVADGNPIHLLVSKTNPQILQSCFIPAVTKSSNWDTSMILTYVPTISYYLREDRYIWASTSVPDVITCDKHHFHIIMGDTVQARSTWTGPSTCSLDDPSTGQIVSQPTPSLGGPVPPMVPMPSKAAAIAAIAKDLDMDVGTSQNKRPAPESVPNTRE